MNFKLKTLLVVSGAVLLAAPALHAQRPVGGVRAAGGSFARGSAFRTNSRPTRNVGYYGRGGYGRGGYGGGHNGHHYGRYYYLGGIPYFYPFGYGYGYGYPGFYGGFYGEGGYGDGFYGPGSDGAGYADRAYEGRVTNGRSGGNDTGQGANNSLPSAVQRQLAKRGYYKGSIDGQFGPASRSALSRFQKSQDLKETGQIDEDTLDALGFTDKR